MCWPRFSGLALQNNQEWRGHGGRPVSVRRPALLADRHGFSEETEYKEGGGNALLLCCV